MFTGIHRPCWEWSDCMARIIPGLTPVLRQTFQGFGLFQGRSVFSGDLPYFEGFSRKVLSFLPGPSLFRRLFKEGPQDLLSINVLFCNYCDFDGFGVERNILIYSNLSKTSR